MTRYWQDMDWPDELLTVLGEPFGAGPAQDTPARAARMQTQSPDTAASGDGRVGTPHPPVPPDRPPMWRPGPWELLGHVVQCFTETVRRSSRGLG